MNTKTYLIILGSSFALMIVGAIARVRTYQSELASPTITIPLDLLFSAFPVHP
jgi:hypothetical protein